MGTIDINDFKEEKSCEYKGRHYLVRDNGAILRLPREGGRASKWDNVWTFGTKDEKTAYMILAGIRVHQVVCAALRRCGASQAGSDVSADASDEGLRHDAVRPAGVAPAGGHRQRDGGAG